MADIITADRAQRAAGPGLSYWLGTKIANQPLAMEAGLAARLQGAIKDKAFDPAVALGFDASKYVGAKVGSAGYRVTDDHIAVVPVQGVLLDRGEWLGDRSGWMTSYEGLAEQFRRIAKDEAIGTVILDIDSGGGMAAGLFDLTSELEALKKTKRVVAVAANFAASAAYAIGCAAHEFYTARLGTVGSIGVISIHTSWAEALTSMGVEATIIHAGAHKPNGNMFQPLSHMARAEMSGQCDLIYDRFCAHVARHRRLDEATVRGTEARVYMGEEGVKAGLVCGVKSFEEVLEHIRNGSKTASAGGSPRKGRKMPNDSSAAARPDYDAVIAAALTSMAAQVRPPAGPAQPLVAQPAAVTLAAVAPAPDGRARVKAILSAAAAKDRPALAQHLALETDLDAATAEGILAKAAPETAAAATGAGDALAAQMAKAGNSGGVKPEAASEGTKSASAHRPPLAKVFAGRIGVREQDRHKAH